MEPINYLSQVADPFAQSLEGFKLGAGIVELQQKQAFAEQARQQQQLALQEQARFFAKPNPTMRDALQFASVLPKDRADALRPYIENFSKEQQQNVLKANGQILSALQVNPAIGIKMLQDYATAQRTSGDIEEAALYERLAEAAADPERGPGVVFKSLVTVTSRIPGAKEMFETIDKAAGTAREDEQAPSKLRQAVAVADKAVADATTAQATATNAAEKAAADAAKATADAAKAAIDSKFAERKAKAELDEMAGRLGLTSAQAGQARAMTQKLGIESKKAAIELQALKATGGLDPAKSFDQEEKLRKEYQGRTKIYNMLGPIYENMKTSSVAKNGPGDIALITQFMKMIDPESVVRETEFATARDTAGLYDKLRNQAQKLESGQMFSLDSKQRAEYVNLAKQYLDAAQKKAGEEKKSLGVVVKNYRLNPENVFGPEPVAPATPVSAPVVVGGKTYARPANFTDAQWAAYKQATGVK